MQAVSSTRIRQPVRATRARVRSSAERSSSPSAASLIWQRSTSPEIDAATPPIGLGPLGYASSEAASSSHSSRATSSSVAPSERQMASCPR